MKWWITFNEPLSFCAGYGEERAAAPGIDAHGIGDYLCGHTVLHSHARAYQLYDKVFRKKQKGITTTEVATYHSRDGNGTNSSYHYLHSFRNLHFNTANVNLNICGDKPPFFNAKFVLLSQVIETSSELQM